MTTQELQNHIVAIRWNGCGAFKVTIEYRNKNYSCHSHNYTAYDAYRGSKNGYTYKQALQAFYNECKTLNYL